VARTQRNLKAGGIQMTNQSMSETAREAMMREEFEKSPTARHLDLKRESGIDCYYASKTQEKWDAFRCGYIAASGIDDPELDGTDWAHPAWWRGHDQTFLQFCTLTTELLDGKKILGVCGEPWESIRHRIATLSTLPTMTREEIADTCELRELCTAIVSRSFPVVLPLGHYAIEEAALIELKQLLERIANPHLLTPEPLVKPTIHGDNND